MRWFTAISISLTAALAGLAGCEGRSINTPQAVSLLGRPLYRPTLSSDQQVRRTAQLRQAMDTLEAAPGSEEAVIWVGRRLAYLGEYQPAIVMFSYGLAVHPESHKLLRHRGHRYITTRRLDLAIRDLERAAELIEGVPDEIEPDGMPNRLGIPTSTSHTNIHYHLALAHYLRGEYASAQAGWQRCLDLAANDDMRCAAGYWLFLAASRAGAGDAARSVLEGVSADMNVIENHAYLELLMMFKGELTPEQVIGSDADAGPVGVEVDDATRAYGVGAYYLLAGRRNAAHDIFQRIVEGAGWAAFGHIAAEAELARSG